MSQGELRKGKHCYGESSMGKARTGKHWQALVRHALDSQGEA